MPKYRHFKHQKVAFYMPKKWCVKRQYRHFKLQNLFMKSTPGTSYQKLGEARKARSENQETEPSFFIFFQKRRSWSCSRIPSLRRDCHHHHERVPKVQVRRPRLSRLLRSHTSRIDKAQISFKGLVFSMFCNENFIANKFFYHHTFMSN